MRSSTRIRSPYNLSQKTSETRKKLTMNLENQNQLTPEEGATLIEKMRQYCQSAAFENLFKRQLDFSEASIARLDNLIAIAWPEPPAHLDTMVGLFGYYLGETACRQLNWQWVAGINGDWHIEAKTVNAMAFPFAKVRRRFLNGTEDSLKSYYRVLKEMGRAV